MVGWENFPEEGIGQSLVVAEPSIGGVRNMEATWVALVVGAESREGLGVKPAPALDYAPDLDSNLMHSFLDLEVVAAPDLCF